LQLLLFLTLPIAGGEWSASIPAVLSPGKVTALLTEEECESFVQSGGCEF